MCEGRMLGVYFFGSNQCGVVCVYVCVCVYVYVHVCAHV